MSHPASTNKYGREYQRGKPLSLEMRQKVAAMIDEGKSPAEISAALKIVRVTVERWRARYLKTGSINASGWYKDESMDLEPSKDSVTSDSSVQEYEGTSNGMTRQRQDGSLGSESVSSGLSNLQRMELRREATRRKVRRLSYTARLSSASKRTHNQLLPDRRATVVSRNSLLPRRNYAGSTSSTSAASTASSSSTSNTVTSTKPAESYRSLRSSDLPQANVSPQAHSTVQLRESPLSPPPLTIPNHMRRLDVPLSDRHYPITLVINPPSVAMATGNSSASTAEATANGVVPAQPLPHPSKIIIEIRYA